MTEFDDYVIGNHDE